MYVILWVAFLTFHGGLSGLTNAQEQETPITCQITLRGLPQFSSNKGLDPGTLVPYELVRSFSISCVGEGTPIELEAHRNVIQAAESVEGVTLIPSKVENGFLTFRDIEGVTLKDSMFDNLIGGGLAPLMLVNSGVQLVNCTFNGNSLARAGAMHISSSVVVMHRSKMYGNTGLSYGAIGAVEGSKLSLTDCVVEGNVGGTQMDVLGGFVSGGIFSFKNTILKIKNTLFDRNLALGSGGGAVTSVNKCIVNITNSQFEDHEGGSGAVGLFQFSSANIVGSDFVSNRANDDGAALTLRINSMATLVDTKFQANSGSSGAILARGDSELSITGGRFFMNEGTAYSGAVSVFGGTDTKISSTTFEGNMGLNGGSVYGEKASSTTIKGSKFMKNVGLRFGGAVYQSNCDSTTIGSCVFSGNTADIAGGAVMQVGCEYNKNDGETDGVFKKCEIPELVRCNSVMIKGSKFEDNSSEGWGSDIFQKGCMDVQVMSSKFLSKSEPALEGTVYQEKCSAQSMEENIFKAGAKNIKPKGTVISKDCPSEGI
ncbi:hypothetical protein BSKO_11286 [Bryopsis sp. KO-2023]|nr:hypothetical protein BSKO_11286 [Bryopsis sp. KO-2023]